MKYLFLKLTEKMFSKKIILTKEMSDINQIDGKKQQCLYNRETRGVCHTRKQINKIKGFKD